MFHKPVGGEDNPHYTLYTIYTICSFKLKNNCID